MMTSDPTTSNLSEFVTVTDTDTIPPTQLHRHRHRHKLFPHVSLDSARTRELDAHILLTSDPFHTLTYSLEVGSGTLTDRTGIALRPKLTLD
jgi:hypothetical protein